MSKFSKSTLIVTICLFIIGVVTLPIIADMPQVYHDIILENVAIQGGNKSGEIKLFWILLIITILAIFYINNKYPFEVKDLQTDSESTKLLIAILIIPNVIIWFFSGTINVNYLILSGFLLYINSIEKKYVWPFLMSYFGVYYSILSIKAVVAILQEYYVISVFLEKIQQIDLVFIQIISFITSLVLFFKYRNDQFKLFKVSRLLQVFLPISLIVFLKELYYYNGQIYRIALPITYKWIIISLIILMLTYSWRFYKKNNAEIVCVTTIIIIFVLNSYQGPSAIIASDWHHTGENIITWGQIFTQGQNLYLDYIPASGLFAILPGFVRDVLLGGTYASTNAAFTLVIIFISVITILLMWHFVGKLSIIYALWFCTPVYNRAYLVLPILLILLLPGLLKRRNLWLKCWVWCIFISGLYYPSYGVGMLVGTLPIGIWQGISFYKYDLKKVKIKRFIFGWIIILLPIFLTMPMLVRMARHILTMSSQSVLADGITIFGQEVPTSFIPWLNLQQLRKGIYYGLRVYFPIFPLLLLLIAGLRFIPSESKEKDCIIKLNLLTGGVVLLISYTYSIIRSDTYDLTARSQYLIQTVGVGFSLVLLATERYRTRISKNLIVLAVSFGVLSSANFWLPYSGGTNNRVLNNENIGIFDPFYIVPSDYVLASTELKQIVPQMGECFILNEQEKLLIDEYNTLKLINKKNMPVLNISPGQWAYEFLEQKIPGVALSTTNRSWEASQEIIGLIDDNNLLVKRINSWDNYYLYYWLMDNEYIYNKKYDYAVARENYYEVFGEPVPSQIDYSYVISDNISYGNSYKKIPSELGDSINSLKPIFEEVFNISSLDMASNGGEHYSSISFSKPICGKDADFLYIKFFSDVNLNKDWRTGIFNKNEREEMIDVTIEWNNEEMSFYYGQGALLIPLGANPEWLLNDHDKIDISIQAPEEYKNNHFSIEEISFMKLKQTNR